MRLACLFALLTALSAAPCLAQVGLPPQPDPGAYEPNERTATTKDPATATLLSVVFVGGGHFYAGETGRGLLLLSLSAAAVGGGLALASIDVANCSSCASRASSIAYAGALLAAVPWFVGMADAGNAARRHNRRYGLAVSPSVGRTAPETGGEPWLGVRVEIGL